MATRKQGSSKGTPRGKAPTSAGGRTLWKGAISFGLVHIPVGLHTATVSQGVDFDWLDKRSMDPVGYKRVNKRTGREISMDNIVKGVAYRDGEYVVISPEEIEAAYPRTTQTIEILRFVDGAAIPFLYLERPYYVAPIQRGQKVFALLRETLARSGKVGLAKVVIATREHLAALIPAGDALVLNLLRWGDDVKRPDGLDLPATGAKGPKLSAAELKMARQLVDEMSGPFDPTEYRDEFRHQVMALVERKARAGKTETVIEPQEEAPAAGADIIDLAALLKRSLGGAKPAARSTPKRASSEAGEKEPAPKKAAAKKAAPKKAAAKKAAATRRRA